MKTTLVGAASAISGLALGVTIGHILTKRHMMKVIDTVVDEEVERATRHLERKYKVGKYATPEEAISTLLEEVEKGSETKESEESAKKSLNEIRDYVSTLGYSSTATETSDDDRMMQQESMNIFDRAVELDEDGNEITDDSPDDGFEDDEVEEEDKVDDFFLNRDHSRPFVISYEEFMNEKEEWDKINISYYEGDDTLCDDNERVIVDVEATVGYDNLTRFGDHSKDKNTVYIRNAQYSVDYEVVRNDGEYAVRVLGMEPEKTKIRRMRDDE